MAGLSFLSNLETNKTFDRIFNVGMLLILTLIVRATYAIYVRPAAEHFVVEQQNLVNADPNYKGKRSILVIIQEPQPEAAYVIRVVAADPHDDVRILDENRRDLVAGHGGPG